MLLPLLVLASLQQAGTGPAPYWQQRVAYEIDASLDETRGVLSGTQRLHYQNNSPDTLRTLSFHLYLNAFRPGSRWAAADSVEGRRRFNDLKDPNEALLTQAHFRSSARRASSDYRRHIVVNLFKDTLETAWSRTG